MMLSPREMADIYARTIGAMTEAYVASTRMATNMVFAGMEAARATTNYTRQNAKEAARITSNTARTLFAQTAKERVQVEGEQGGGSSASGISSSFGSGGEGSVAGSESRGAATTTNFASEGTVASSSGTGSTTAGAGAGTETTTGTAEKIRKK
jgi:hypothetical protein